jgi:hypothetical protein
VFWLGDAGIFYLCVVDAQQAQIVVDHVKTYLFELAANQRFDIIA